MRPTYAHERGSVSQAPLANGVFNAVEVASLTPMLRHPITTGSLPLRSIAPGGAIDATELGASGRSGPLGAW